MGTSLRPARVALAIAAVTALVMSIAPSAFAETADPTPTPEPTPTVLETLHPEPTAEPEAQPSAQPTPLATPDVLEAPANPSPIRGDYLGSATIHEANPGNYFETQRGGIDAQPAWRDNFRPGNLISDEKLYTSGTMTALQIQYFFEQKVPRCNSGYTCLKDFRQSTESKSPNSYCTGRYAGAANERASTIISKVSKACGVSERALIVMLQKEQGLVTHVWPSQFRYDIAMGYACPDTGPGNSANCDSSYFGFQNQMYMAAYQLQRYSKDTYFNWFPVGKSSRVQYHPNVSCGTQSVLIENKATAALYYYTPYVPNRASLDAGYGTGDSCSSYGNRNFVNYYTDWFGSTHGPEKPAPQVPTYEVSGEIGAHWRSLGGAQSVLGDPVANKRCGIRDGGCYQAFKSGRIYWSGPGTAAAISGAGLDRYRALGSEWSSLGYPTRDTVCGLAGGGCYQQFQQGKLYWHDGREAVIVQGTASRAYQRIGNENGSLRLPLADAKSLTGGAYQQFQGGKVYWRSGGTGYSVTGTFSRKYGSLGNENGTLGFPTRDRVTTLRDGGSYQQFQRGKLYQHGTRGVVAVHGQMSSTYKRHGNENGSLGYPTRDRMCGLTGGGCYQQFQSGKIFQMSATSRGYAVHGAPSAAYRARGNENGWLGYPTSNASCAGDNCRQSFENGSMTWKKGSRSISVHRS
ncbi:hypothetical protein [Microbacterium amylolyticum]|uniref:LGFP repeat-containing protein n=1 Tax=Microbacterium amylolyticum TaxID=936337 RepID=A0ABS4ZK40_9MICO|nr:hypothetical protein [Microbacterium amylolyticum]MBP2437567.1 hypothetical protein [Microbacterium amylolyticum]